ncbi:hypothetical protein [Anatilimnocola floriformis]|uniref:hypothetical protein n=1 Tax=Anatilimnocola floriformis TaxID=2948575 RepID=UPI0020C3C98C|nr:hypothetical protein [Anatilimnocola floriformis]
MSTSHRLITAVCLLASIAAVYVSAAEMFPGHHCGCPHCQVVEEIVYQDVVTHVCKLHPDKKQKKKTVYECKEVPYCVHKLSCPLKHDTCCEQCKECECCARYKKVLIKKEIVVSEECTTKCVPEPVVQRVPVKVCRVIPCAKCAAAGAPCTQCAPAPVPAAPATTTPIQVPTPPVDQTSFSISDLAAPVHVK